MNGQMADFDELLNATMPTECIPSTSARIFMGTTVESNPVRTVGYTRVQGGRGDTARVVRLAQVPYSYNLQTSKYQTHPIVGESSTVL